MGADTGDRPGPDGWTVEQANAALPRVAPLVRRIRELVEQARIVGVLPGQVPNGHGMEAGREVKPLAVAPAVEAEVRDAIHALSTEGVVLRHAGKGLVDFTARTAAGREYLLCWELGEPSVAWWHWPEDGYGGRTPIADLPR